MQTFLPYADFAECARVLDDKRLGKQRVECLQILKALQPPETCPTCKGTGILSVGWIRDAARVNYQCPKCMAAGVLKRAWSNHPATRMWLGYTDALVEYGLIMSIEWRERGFDDTCRDKIHAFAVKKHYGDDEQLVYPPWLGDERIHSSHRAALLYKNPAHYSQFGWTETPKQDYYWPV
jgi:hypothetical protein